MQDTTLQPIPQSINRHCFHCGLPIPDAINIEVDIESEARPMCCHGCATVAKTITQNGLADYYRFRDQHALTATEVVPDIVKQLSIYDNEDIQKSFVTKHSSSIRQAHLILEGIVCAACVWLNEQHLQHLKGVLDVNINYSTHRASIRWDNDQITLSQILKAVSEIGYIAHPYDPDRQQNIIEKQRKDLLKKIGVAAGFGMQVMVVAVALYAGAYSGMESAIQNFLYWTSFILTLPVFLYAAQPFFQGAIRDLMQYRAGMDVPVALGMTLAFAGSIYAVLYQTGEIYFDSVVMFVFFLLTARYMELQARSKASLNQDRLVRMTPAYCQRYLTGNESKSETIAIAELRVDDVVLVYPGETIPSDGVIIEGCSSVDESVLSGESLPKRMQVNDTVIGGSINYESPLKIRITKTGTDTVLSGIFSLLERASSDKPRITILADHIAQYFVIAVICLAALVAGYYLYHQPELALVTTIAVLVVTCPCALSLATPVAMTAAAGRLTKEGVILTSHQTLEVFATADHIIFDKTGTLTEGRLSISDIHINTENYPEETCLRIAAALEAQSEHPIAGAFSDVMLNDVEAVDVVSHPGRGLSGKVNGEIYYIGSASYIDDVCNADISDDLSSNVQTSIVLASSSEVLAIFYLADNIRVGCADLITELNARNVKLTILSGDADEVVSHVAEQLGITDFHARCLPDDKLAYVHEYQQNGDTVVMVGDGVNDAPVLAAANASIAMASAMQISASSADSLLMSNDLRKIAMILRIARKTVTIIRQNISWAIAYNLMALPAAALGYVPPWMAAIGMSASSLLVVGNSLRLLGRQQRS